MTTKIKHIIAAAIIIMTAPAASAQRQELPTTQVGDQIYYYYDVEPGETIFSISRRLDIPRDQIIAANPSVADGLKAYTRLYFPVDNGQVTSTDMLADGLTHTVGKGETLYGVAHRYGVSVDRIIELNPHARNGVKQGDKLIITPIVDKPATPATSRPATSQIHVIAPGETLYRIAQNNGLTVEQLLVANPTLDSLNYQAGTEIVIPGADAATPASTPVAQSNPSTKTSSAAKPSSSVTKPSQGKPTAKPDTIVVSNPRPTPLPQVITEEEPLPQGPDSFDVALMLPLMLSDETPNRAAMLYTDFYKGFLLAAKQLSKSGKPIRIHVYDTCGSPDSVAAITARADFAKMNLVIGPETEASLTKLIDSVSEDTTFVYNPFVVKNTAYTDHANVIQPNTPHDKMLGKAAEAFVERLDDHTPVFLSRIKGQAEKESFVNEMKTRLTERNIPYEEITFTDVLSHKDLERLDSLGTYTFIPISGTRSEFLKIKDVLLDLDRANPGNISLMGYPDWVTFRGDQLDDITRLDALIYSRFYFDPSLTGSRKVVDLFTETYGEPPIESAPMQAILGYDTGRYIIESLRANGGDFHRSASQYTGLQSDLNLNDTDVEGLVNTAVMLIKFKPDGLVEITKL